MPDLYRVFIAVVVSLTGGLEIGAEEKGPARQSSSFRFGMSSPRAVSPSAKSPSSSPPSKEVGDKTSSADGDAKLKTPKRRPSLDEAILFQPSRDGNWAPTNLKYTDVEFDSQDKTALHGWYCPADAPRAVVLYCHGNAGNVAWMAGFFEFLRVKHRLSVMAFDYRGYGKSHGTPTAEGVIADGRAARAKLAELAGIPAAEVVVWGRSMGGAVAVQLASEERPRGLILECTFDSFKTVAKHHAPNWAFLVPDDRLASVKRIPQVQCPLFQVHGTADRVVPFASGQALYEAANEPKFFVTLRGADHNTASPLKLYDEIDLFLDQKCPTPGKP